MPASTAFCSSSATFGLVGVIAIASTPCVTNDWIAAISPSSSVPLLPWAKTTSAPGSFASHSLAASTMMS